MQFNVMYSNNNFMSTSIKRRFSKTLTRPKNQPLITSNIKGNSSKDPTVSPSQGVPPPEDLKCHTFEDISSLTESFLDFESQDLMSTTKNLAQELRSKLKEYKSSNQEHLKKKYKVHQKVQSCRNEFEVMKNSIGEVLFEAKKTKEELRAMREKIEGESFKECDVIPFYEPQTQVIEQIYSLKNSIDFMNHRLTLTERELEAKSYENEKLKQSLYKIKESIIEKTSLETEESHPHCQVCIII